MKMRVIMLALALGLLGTASTGCVVKTRSGHVSEPVGHNKHTHRHCHERGHKGKMICHVHPHKADHHN